MVHGLRTIRCVPTQGVLWHKMFGPWVTASARLVAQRGIKSLGRLLTTGAQTRLISAPVTSCVKARHRRTRRTVCAEIYGWRVQTCAGLYMARTPEWFISGPCAGPHTPSVRVAHTWKLKSLPNAIADSSKAGKLLKMSVKIPNRGAIEGAML
ncbi:hypothetical protein Bbelb_386040 [Branchiostoma belcheri]|nr:hypothetical protein Bbelb_386040 [Branchiostoma belcheri]